MSSTVCGTGLLPWSGPLRWAATLIEALALLGIGAPAQGQSCAGDGPRGGLFHLDRCDEFEGKGLFVRRHQKLLDAVVLGGALGVAFWQGTETADGRTAWKAVDSMATAAVATELMKRSFQRPRPSQSGDPDQWRQGSGHASFPSGETAMITAFVTPIILGRQEEHPAVWALALLPVYMARARMASQAHWLSDVLVGAGVGAGAGYLASRRDQPLVLRLTGDGVFVGFQQRF